MGIYAYLYILFMISQSKASTETRGRPRKEETRTLSPIYKEKFSDNSAIMHTSFLIYVFQVFVDTKNEKRVGHKDGGFTIYDKIDTQYCFDNIHQQLKLWDCHALLDNQNLRDFVKLLPALGPKVILKEISQLINYIVEREAAGLSEQAIFLELTRENNQQKLDQVYPYMRFVPLALHELKMDKNDRSSNLVDLIRQRVHYLWQHLIRIITHTILNCVYGKVYNKYFKPFFSDAENPSETYIGQLNLAQVVQAVKRIESQERMNNTEQSIEEEDLERPRKMKSFVDIDGTRAVVQIIKAPQQLGIEKKNTENPGLVLESPTRIVRMQSEPIKPIKLEKGFTPIFQPASCETEMKKNKETSESIFQPKSSWKPCQKKRQIKRVAPHIQIEFVQYYEQGQEPPQNESQPKQEEKHQENEQENQPQNQDSKLERVKNEIEGNPNDEKHS